MDLLKSAIINELARFQPGSPQQLCHVRKSTTTQLSVGTATKILTLPLPMLLTQLEKPISRPSSEVRTYVPCQLCIVTVHYAKHGKPTQHTLTKKQLNF